MGSGRWLTALLTGAASLVVDGRDLERLSDLSDFDLFDDDFEERDVSESTLDFGFLRKRFSGREEDFELV